MSSGGIASPKARLDRGVRTGNIGISSPARALSQDCLIERRGSISVANLHLLSSWTCQYSSPTPVNVAGISQRQCSVNQEIPCGRESKLTCSANLPIHEVTGRRAYRAGNVGKLKDAIDGRGVVYDPGEVEARASGTRGQGQSGEREAITIRGGAGSTMLPAEADQARRGKAGERSFIRQA